MGKGILGTIGLAGTMLLAIPIAIAGVDFLFRGDTLVGVAFLVVAVAMVLLTEYLTTPSDVPGSIVERTVGMVVEEPDDDGTTEK